MKMKKILTAFFLAVMLLFSLSASAASLGPKIRVGLVVDQYSAELSSAGKITVIDGRGKEGHPVTRAAFHLRQGRTFLCR